MSKGKTYSSYQQFREDHPDEAERQEREANRKIASFSTVIAAGVLSLTLATSETVQDILAEVAHLVAEQIQGAPRIPPKN